MAKPTAITSNDIARHVGVSRATVSVVLNGAKSSVRVSEATRQRILDAAAELRYTPHRAAQALRRQQSGIMGYVPRLTRSVPYDEPVPSFLSFHVVRAAMQHGFHLIEARTEAEESLRAEEVMKFLLGHRVDGVIFDSPGTAAEVERFVDYEIPVIQLMRPQFSVETSTITVSASGGMAAAADHLVELGHRRIAFLGARDSHPVNRDRLDSFIVGLAKHDIALPQEYVLLEQGHGITEGYALTTAALDLQDRPTALVLSGDNLTLGALRCLYEAELRVPDMMSIVSYDDTFMSQLYPPVTSIAQPLEEVARLAISNLTDQIFRRETACAAPQHIELPTKLVIRESTRALGAHGGTRHDAKEG